MESKTINFKLPKKMRDDFKVAVKKNGGTMQSVMFSLIQFYIDNSDRIKLKLVEERKTDV